MPDRFRGDVPCRGPGCEFVVRVMEEGTPPSEPVRITGSSCADPAPLRMWTVTRAWFRPYTSVRTGGLARTVALDDVQLAFLRDCLRAAVPARRRERGKQTDTLLLETASRPNCAVWVALDGDMVGKAGGRPNSWDLSACGSLVNDLAVRALEHRLR